MSLRSVFRWGPDPEVKAFVADLNGVQYSSYTNQRLWLRTGNTLLVTFIWALLTDHVQRLVDALPFIGVWLGAVSTKSVVTAASRYGKSKTAEKFVRAQAEGKAAAAPQTVVEAKDQSTVKVDASPDAPLTRRHTDRPAGPQTEPNLYADDERGDA